MTGPTTLEAEARLAPHGQSELAHESSRALPQIAVEARRGPMPRMLPASGAIHLAPGRSSRQAWSFRGHVS
jgi:hypothetical protein